MSKGPTGAARRDGRSMKVAQVARVRLPDLPKYGSEAFRLVWLGEVVRPPGATSPTGHRINARFASTTGNRQVNISLPLPALPYLALGSLWRDGFFSGFESSKTATVTVDMGRIAEIHRLEHDPYDIIARSVYPLAMSRRSGCRMLPTSDGRELIVPISELLRTSYFFDARLIEPILGGVFAHPELGSSMRLPWIPAGTFRLSPTEVQLMHRQGLGEGVAKRLGRLLFDDVARRMLGRVAVGYRQRSEASSFLLPFVEPSFDAQATWDVRYIDIPAYNEHPPRRLVLSIAGQNQPLPYESLVLVSDIDTRQGINSDDEGLKPVVRRTSSIVLPDDDGLTLYGSGPDSSVDAAPVAGLAFHDNALDVLIRRPPKELQSYRSAGGGDGLSAVHGLGTDTAGRSDHGLAGQRDAGVDEPESAIAPAAQTPLALVDVRPVFDDIAIALGPMLPGWRVEYLEVPGAAPGVMKVQHHRSKQVRPFLVLHLFHETRHVYLLKAGPLADHERFRLFICERPSGAPISLGLFAQWLSRFPYAYGNKWLDPSSKGLLLRNGDVVHQRRDAGTGEAAMHRAFVERLAGRLAGFVA